MIGRICSLERGTISDIVVLGVGQVFKVILELDHSCEKVAEARESIKLYQRVRPLTYYFCTSRWYARCP